MYDELTLIDVLDVGVLPFDSLRNALHDKEILIPEWLNDVNEVLSYDLNYTRFRSGEKLINNYVKSYLDLNGKLPIQALEEIMLTAYFMNRREWEQLYKVLVTADYNPIENYAMEELETPDLTTIDTSKTTSQGSASNKQKQNIQAFGQSVSTEVGDTSGSKADNESTSNVDFSNTKKESGNRKLTRSGNIGVTTSQQMIESELVLRKKKFIEQVMTDIDKTLVLQVY